MKLKTSFQLLFFLLVIFFYFGHPGTVSALEEFDPTQNYNVHSLPVMSGEPQVIIKSEDESKIEKSESIVSLQTAKDVQNTPSSFDQLKNFVRPGTDFLQHYLKDRWVSWISVLFVFSGISVVSFFLFQGKFATELLRRILRSATNSQIRLVGLISAAVLSASTGVALLTVYNQQIQFFQNATGWQFTPVAEDLLIVGGVLSLGLVFLVGPSLTTAAKYAVASVPAYLPKWQKIINYFTKETKSAFTETEKECEDTINKCSSLFDKTVILLFNYLPGSMPDLGMDDAIINFKNNLLGTPQPQPQAQKTK